MEKTRLTRESLLLTHTWRSFSRCEHLLLVPLPQHRPVLSAAFYFLLHLTKGGRGNWFSSLMFLLFCVSAISRPRQDVNVFSLGSQNGYITWCLSLTVWVWFSLAVSFQRVVSISSKEVSGRSSVFCFLLLALLNGRLSPYSCRASQLSSIYLLQGPGGGHHMVAGPWGKMKYCTCHQVTAILVNLELGP